MRSQFLLILISKYVYIFFLIRAIYIDSEWKLIIAKTYNSTNNNNNNNNNKIIRF